MYARVNALLELAALNVTALQHNVARDNKMHVLVEMDPEQFLQLTTPNVARAKEIVAEAEPLDRYNDWSRSGETLNAPFLRLDERGRVIGHEGRHRAGALVKKRIFRMPVFVKLTTSAVGSREAGWEHFPRIIYGEFGRGAVYKSEIKLLKDKVALPSWAR